jgi:hypothetical protein
MLEDARRLNERCFAALARAVKAHPNAHGAPALQVLSEFASRIDAGVCERAGSCPVLLADLYFSAPDYWDRIRTRMRSSAPIGPLSKEVASPLLHEILMQAWTLAHTAPRAASLFFGMAPQVTQLIAKLTGGEIERIAQEHAVDLRPRWEDRRTFWQRLLEAVTGNSQEALVDVQLHCLSLLGGELVPIPRVG